MKKILLNILRWISPSLAPKTQKTAQNRDFGDTIGILPRYMILQDYALTDIDDTTSTEYYGYTDKNGNWYIKQITSSAMRFIRGTSSYATNWTGRAGLTYGYFYDIF